MLLRRAGLLAHAIPNKRSYNSERGDGMRTSTLREFRDHGARLIRDAQPLLVTRRGRLAGVFLPWTSQTLPPDLKRELFLALSADIGRQLKKAKISEATMLPDFDV
jgi:hypothetical protein